MRDFIYLFSISTILPTSTAANLEHTVAINRQNNDFLLKTNDKSSSLLLRTVDDNPTNKLKMNENQSNGIS